MTAILANASASPAASTPAASLRATDSAPAALFGTLLEASTAVSDVVEAAIEPAPARRKTEREAPDVASLASGVPSVPVAAMVVPPPFPTPSPAAVPNGEAELMGAGEAGGLGSIGSEGPAAPAAAAPSQQASATPSFTQELLRAAGVADPDLPDAAPPLQSGATAPAPNGAAPQIPVTPASATQAPVATAPAAAATPDEGRKTVAAALAVSAKAITGKSRPDADASDAATAVPSDAADAAASDEGGDAKPATIPEAIQKGAQAGALAVARPEQPRAPELAGAAGGAPQPLTNAAQATSELSPKSASVAAQTRAKPSPATDAASAAEASGTDAAASTPDAPQPAAARHGEPTAPAASPDRTVGASSGSAAPAPSPAASPQVATAAVAAVATAIAANAGARRTRFEVRLDPDDLGRVDVRLDIAHDGRVATRLIVDRPETLNMLRHDARELTRTLEQAGFQLPDAGLSFQLRDGRQDSWRDQQAAQSFGSAGVVNTPDAPAEAAPVPYHRPARTGAGGVDMTV